MNNHRALTGVRAIIGLGNPGKRFSFTRHNIGFLVVDHIADQHNAHFTSDGDLDIAHATINDQNIVLIKPQTFMNNSGDVILYLKKKGVKPDEILVIHDELEKKFGRVGIKLGGSARGHNGLRSIIERIGPDFARLWCGIDRPAEKSHVSDYVLQPFTENVADVEAMVYDAAQLAISKIKN